MPTRRILTVATLLIANVALAEGKKPAPVTPPPESVACAKRVLGAAKGVRESDPAKKEEVATAWRALKEACGECVARLTDATPGARNACTTVESIESQRPGDAAPKTRGVRRETDVGKEGCHDFDCFREEFKKRTAIAGCDDYGC